jgi:hypothetical protein
MLHNLAGNLNPHMNLVSAGVGVRRLHPGCERKLEVQRKQGDLHEPYRVWSAEFIPQHLWVVQMTWPLVWTRILDTVQVQ